MSSTLLALLLVASSADGESTLVYRYPPSPSPSPRLSRPQPADPLRAEMDNLAKSGRYEGYYLKHMNAQGLGAGKPAHAGDAASAHVYGQATGYEGSPNEGYRWKRAEATGRERAASEASVYVPAPAPGPHAQTYGRIPYAAPSSSSRSAAPSRNPSASSTTTQDSISNSSTSIISAQRVASPAMTSSALPTPVSATHPNHEKKSNSLPTRDDSASYDTFLSYPASLLASLLTPPPAACFQRFELVIDDLAFIGHPVCVDEDGAWSLRGRGDVWREKEKNSRGRRARGEEKRGSTTTSRSASTSTSSYTAMDGEAHDDPTSPRKSRSKPTPKSSSSSKPTPKSSSGSSSQPKSSANKKSSLHTLHLVTIIDPPDPSSAHAGYIARYYDAVYEHLAFVGSAVLWREQVGGREVREDGGGDLGKLDGDLREVDEEEVSDEEEVVDSPAEEDDDDEGGWVERECETLGRLREGCLERGDPYSTYNDLALQQSPLAQFIEQIYTALKKGEIAYVTLRGLPLEIQLPPALDAFIHFSSSLSSAAEYDDMNNSSAYYPPVPDWNTDTMYGPMRPYAGGRGGGGRASEVEAELETMYPDDEEALRTWAPELSLAGTGTGEPESGCFGWQGLPAVQPWKALLLLSDYSNGSWSADPLPASYGHAHHQHSHSHSQSQSHPQQAQSSTLLRLLETASPTLTLADLASLLDWDLESEVYPVVRWLVLHRRAKVVDWVHPGLRTVFGVSRVWSVIQPSLPGGGSPINGTRTRAQKRKTLAELSEDFHAHFVNHMDVLPSLAELLAMVSYPSVYARHHDHYLPPPVRGRRPENSPARFQAHGIIPGTTLKEQVHAQAQTTPSAQDQPAHTPNQPTHFFGTVVRNKAFVPLYLEVVNWLLERDMLVTMHLRVRIVASKELKARVRMRGSATGRKNKNKSRTRGRTGMGRERKGSMMINKGKTTARRESFGVEPGMGGISASFRSGGLHARFRERRGSGGDAAVFDEDDEEEDNGNGDGDGLDGLDDTEDGHYEGSDGGDEGVDGEEHDTDEEERGEDPSSSLVSSLIDSPGQATALQRRWLEAMSEGKDARVRRRFEQINQYFDGKKTDDEILFRAEISRKQLREVLHHYDEYVQIFLHP